MNEKKLEEKKLKEVISRYMEVLEDLELIIKTLPMKYQNNPELLDALLKQYKNKQRIITEGLKKPYFARIDFKDDMQENTDICYIGKVGVSDFDNNLVTIDWRAPIASLYYDSNLGRVSYEAPDGIISGYMSLKRQYEIENGNLKSYNDVDTVSNDEILKPYLSVNADNRLKNIVSSIQNEQNQVIRRSLFDNIIVQGVAGSGKTTVALHRIAYLAYNYRDKIKSNQYMIIGPNKFFINYISSVLPDLDVTDVPQLTYDEFTKEYLSEYFDIVDSPISKTSFNSNKFKMSMLYKEIIDRYVTWLEENFVLPDRDFCIKKFQLLPKNIIKDIYNNIDDTYMQSIDEKIERCILMTSTYLKSNINKVISELNLQYTRLTEGDISNQLIADFNQIKKELESTGCISSLRKYFTFKNKKTTVLYNDMIKNIINFTDDKGTLEIKNTQIKGKGVYTFEDLPGLVYLNWKLHGSKSYKNIRQTVIDEAQDYGTFNFYALKKVLSSSSFSIFGDLAQSIYDYRSIDDWDSVIKESFNEDCQLEYLLKSYRTTTEIMSSANSVLSYIGLKNATPVIRHGENVRYIKVSEDYYEVLLNRVNNLRSKNYQSIALISRTDEDAINITENLRDLGLEIRNVGINDSVYNGGVCSVSSQLSKGLEFDAVIITDASENKYSSNNTTDMKSLYVSMTRPLHELEILYRTDLSKPLQNDLENQKVKHLK